VSSKNNIKKSDNYNDKAEQQALKEAEIVAELAPNEKTRGLILNPLAGGVY
jgi:hypothetical protein